MTRELRKCLTTSPTGPDFSHGDGLLPAIAQDAATGEVLMMAYMNAESYAETLATGRAVYYSRSRNKLWRKGEESGNVQNVRAIYVDCDRDTILLSRRPDRRRGLPRRLQELFLPPGHARRSESDRPAGVRPGGGLWKEITPAWGPSNFRVSEWDCPLQCPTPLQDQDHDEHPQTRHSRRQSAGGDRGVVSPRRLQDHFQLAKLLSDHRRRRDRVPVDPRRKWPATWKRACWTRA